MKVLGNRVLVKRMDDNALKSSVIEVITLGREEPSVYAVVAGIGPGLRCADGHYIPIECKEGDIVILKKYSGAPVTLNGAKDGQTISEDFHLVDAEDVLAVREP